METLAELNKKYKAVFDSMKNMKNEVIVNDNVDSDSTDSTDSSGGLDPLGISLVIAIANGRYDRWIEYGDCSESSDEDLKRND